MPPSAPNGTAGTPAFGWTSSAARTDRWSTRSSTTSCTHSKATGRSPSSSPKSSPADGVTGSCRTSEDCCWQPSCAPAPTSSSAPSPTGSPHDNSGVPGQGKEALHGNSGIDRYEACPRRRALEALLGPAALACGSSRSAVRQPSWRSRRRGGRARRRSPSRCPGPSSGSSWFHRPADRTARAGSQDR
jgi:hypothetical protein